MNVTGARPRRWLRFASLSVGGLVVVLLLVVLGVVIYVELNASPSFDDTPKPSLRASDDPAVIARGEYLAHAVGHCSECHAAVDDKLALRDRPPLSGGEPIVVPFGTFWPPNITPDDETGVGGYTDAELARVMRHGVLRDGRVAAFMSVALGSFADDDLVALISYLRAQPPVKREMPATELAFPGDALLAFGILAPKTKTPPPYAPPSEEPSAARGRYLAEGPANCIGCHTESNPVAGFAFVREPFSGGGAHGSAASPDMVYVPPNLTPDPTTGAITSWSEDEFVARFREPARPYPDSIMPWDNYAQMTRADLQSLYRFLRSLPPVAHDPGPAYRPR